MFESLYAPSYFFAKNAFFDTVNVLCSAYARIFITKNNSTWERSVALITIYEEEEEEGGGGEEWFIGPIVDILETYWMT